MGNEEMKELLLRNMLKKHNSEEEKEAHNYNETIRNVKAVLSQEAENEAPLLERRDRGRVAFTTNQDDLQITVAIDEPLHSLLIEMDPLIHCSDVEANYFMFYGVLSRPSFGSVDFESVFKRLLLKAEVSFRDEAVSETSLLKILNTLKEEVSQVREHISEIRGKISKCVLDDYDELIYLFEHESDSSEESEFMCKTADTIDRAFKALGCVYYGPSSSQQEDVSLEWLVYLNRLSGKFLSKITIYPERVLRVAVYYASPVKGYYFRQAARYCCNWASNLKTGHITFDRNYGFGMYIDQYLHTPLTEKLLISLQKRCLQGLEEIKEDLHNNANGILKCSFEPEDESVTVESLEALRHLLSRLAERSEDSSDDSDSGDGDQSISVDEDNSRDGNQSISVDEDDSGDEDQRPSIDDSEPGQDYGRSETGRTDWTLDEDQAM